MDVCIAHRGLWNNKYPENSLGAFKEAVRKKIAVEFDVRLTRDNKLVVFHDKRTGRMCEADIAISEASLRTLKYFWLKDSDERIPELKEVLDVINGKVPILVELKPDKNYGTLTRKFLDAIKDYNGEIWIESFNKQIIKTIKLYTNRYKCGLLSRGLILRHKDIDFIAYDITRRESIRFKLTKFFCHVPLVGWTAKHKHYNVYMPPFNHIIFDYVDIDV